MHACHSSVYQALIEAEIIDRGYDKGTKFGFVGAIAN